MHGSWCYQGFKKAQIQKKRDQHFEFSTKVHQHMDVNIEKLCLLEQVISRFPFISMSYYTKHKNFQKVRLESQ